MLAVIMHTYEHDQASTLLWLLNEFSLLLNDKFII